MNQRSRYIWRHEAPEQDGDFYYSGLLPRQDGEEVVLIVQVFTDPKTRVRMAATLIPPGWRGDMSRIAPVVHFDRLEKWTGMWSGPEHGLVCVEVTADTWVN